MGGGVRIVTYIPRDIRNPRAIALAARGYLRGLVATNRYLMRQAKQRGEPLPSILSEEADVVWQREPWAGRFEEFEDVGRILDRGWGDCDGLTAALIAELQEKGVPADFKIYWKLKPNGDVKLFHCQVRVRPKWNPKLKRWEGKVVDPSRILGM